MVLISQPDDEEGFIKLLGQINNYEILKKELAMIRVGRLTTSCEEGIF
jgi:hypothetical protein